MVSVDRVNGVIKIQTLSVPVAGQKNARLSSVRVFYSPETWIPRKKLQYSGTVPVLFFVLVRRFVPPPKPCSVPVCFKDADVLHHAEDSFPAPMFPLPLRACSFTWSHCCSCKSSLTLGLRLVCPSSFPPLMPLCLPVFGHCHPGWILCTFYVCVCECVCVFSGRWWSDDHNKT